MSVAVDLITNTFERTYRAVLTAEFFHKVVQQNRRDFARKIVVINNVTNIDEARRRAQELVARRLIDEFHVVDEHVEQALEITGLQRRDLGRIPHYSDWALVAVSGAGSPWILHWDADVELVESVNWVDPALEILSDEPRILTANPDWLPDGVERETIIRRRGFALGYGFSDQLFLGRRQEFAAPIYHHWCCASRRYPLAHVAYTFEARVDAYMRTHRRLRATALTAVYRHRARPHPEARPSSWSERARLLRNRHTVRWLKRSNSLDPRRRIFWQ